MLKLKLYNKNLGTWKNVNEKEAIKEIGDIPFADIMEDVKYWGEDTTAYTYRTKDGQFLAVSK